MRSNERISTDGKKRDKDSPGAGTGAEWRTLRCGYWWKVGPDADWLNVRDEGTGAAFFFFLFCHAWLVVISPSESSSSCLLAAACMHALGTVPIGICVFVQPWSQSAVGLFPPSSRTPHQGEGTNENGAIRRQTAWHLPTAHVEHPPTMAALLISHAEQSRSIV